MKRFIAVAGNIGAGKSTLVRLLSEHLGYRPYFEPVTENPFLADFYADMHRWAFHSQVFFLSFRMQSHHELVDNAEPVVQDRSVYEDAEIFAEHLYRTGALSERDYRTYRRLYELFLSLLAPPDLVIYLRAPATTLMDRIARRGRAIESAIGVEYVTGLNELYEEWIARFDLAPVLTIAADRIDLLADDEVITDIAERSVQAMEGR